MFTPSELRKAMVDAGYVKANGLANVNAFARVFDPSDPERGETKLRRWLAGPDKHNLRRLAILLERPEWMPGEDFLGYADRGESLTGPAASSPALVKAGSRLAGSAAPQPPDNGRRSM